MRPLERYFYRPSFLQKIFAISLLPFSLLYCLIATLKRRLSPTKDFHLPIISIGNLIAGGSGKTPFIIETTKDYSNIAIISRGYKRQSKGLIVVSINGKLQTSQKQAGDEAYLIAKMAKNATVIVSKKRDLAILKAKELGCRAIFLDDGFRFAFKKLNILLKPQLEPYFRFCIPSGLYRENPSLYKQADILATEGIDYKRKVSISNPTEKMLLVTAIANPSRLDTYIPEVVGKLTFADHSDFDTDYLLSQAKKYNATSLLITQKDAVKLENFPFKLSIMELSLEVNPTIKEKINSYIETYR